MDREFGELGAGLMEKTPAPDTASKRRCVFPDAPDALVVGRFLVRQVAVKILTDKSVDLRTTPFQIASQRLQVGLLLENHFVELFERLLLKRELLFQSDDPR